MPKIHENVRATRNRMTPGQRHELVTAISKVIPEDMPADVAQHWIGHGRSLKIAMYQALMPLVTTGDPLVDWANLYKKCFGLDVGFGGLKIPKKKEGFGRLIVVARGLTPHSVYEACQKLFACASAYEDLNQVSSFSTRDSAKSYAVWVREREQADVENQGVSVNALHARGANPITLVERMLYEMKYFVETGKHLDTTGTFTVCAGSRFSEGCVPGVYAHHRGIMSICGLNELHQGHSLSAVREVVY